LVSVKYVNVKQDFSLAPIMLARGRLINGDKYNGIRVKRDGNI
jgi:hypothetical protein